jgi:PST family polysaccharide transporter
MLTEKKNKLSYNFFSLSIVQVINSMLQLLVIPYVIRIIGADGFGVVAVAQVVMFYLSVFTEYGFSQTATREIALNRADKTKVSRIYFRVLFSKIILCGFAFVLLLILLATIPFFRAHALLYLMGFVFVAGQSVLATWFFQGIEKMEFIAFATLIARILFVLFVFLFIKNKSDDFLFLFFLGIGNFIAGIISIFLALRIFKLKYLKPSLADIVQELKEGWHITVTNLSNNTCQYANVFILRIFTNDLLVGYYSIAERIFFTIKQMLGIFSQSIYPRVCQLVQNVRLTGSFGQGKRQVISFFRQIYIPFFGLVIAGVIVLFVFSRQILSFFMGNDYGNAVFLLHIFLIVSIAACLNIPATLVLLALDRKKNYFRIYTLAAVLNIVINIILVNFFNAAGTVIAVLITELFIMVGLAFEMYRHYYLRERTSAAGTVL